MKKILLALMMLVAGSAQAYQIYSPLGTSDTSVAVNSKDGKALLKQDMIDNVNSPQTTRSLARIFGKRSIVNNALCDLWDGPTCVYVFPTVGQQMAFVSSSASDTLAGTGVQKMHIHYLDTNGAEQVETVSMNGVTPVLTVATNILRINGMHSWQLGTGGAPAGNISLTNSGGTVTYGYQTIGFNTARQAIFTVPAGKYGYLSHWQAGSGTASGTHFTPVYLRATSHLGVLLPGVFLVIDEIATENSGLGISLPIPIRVPPLTDVKMSAVSDSGTAAAQVMGAIMGWFETQ